LKYCWRTAGGNIVFSSSATVYGTTGYTTGNRRYSQRGGYQSIRQHQAEICEDILTDAVKAHPTLQGIILRYFNPIGAHPSALMGRIATWSTQTTWCLLLLKQPQALEMCCQIFGSDYNNARRNGFTGLYRCQRLGTGTCKCAAEKMYHKKRPPALVKFTMWEQDRPSFCTGTRSKVLWQ